uniref:Uncharacterized protein n=1 Tax=Arundo donax TaxID=35708 RepID=A0A0A8ZHB4_ARUDO
MCRAEPCSAQAEM